MDLSYTYFKIRRNFGSQPMFHMVAEHLIDSIAPDKALQKQFGLRNPVHKECQISAPVSEQHINTERAEHTTAGVNHAEGGWPKDINFNDEEATARFRRRVERDDDYVNAVLTLAPKIEHLLDQNNALDVYNLYFKGMPTLESIDKTVIKVNHIYKDPVKEKLTRPVASIAWTYEDDPKLVVAYCNKKFSMYGPINENFTSCVWNLENPTTPIQVLKPPTACWQLACSPASPTIIVGGLADGRVCIFDIRENQIPVGTSKLYLAQREPVTSLLYMQSRLNYEFFCGSTDGSCFWYDIRNISRPTEYLIMSLVTAPGQIPKLDNSEPVSVLQYDRAFPTKFLCGTDTGLVINVNRKGKSYSEIMSSVFNAHDGSVKAIHRSPCSSKIFITCGDWTVHIWNEDIKTSPIITGTTQCHQILDVVWAPNRVSGYMSVGQDGKLRYWDILRKLREPIMVLPLSKYPLLKIKPHDDGRLVAIGDYEGSLYLLTLSDILVESGERDKQMMVQMYERESHREHILETRVKEIRLKAKLEQEAPVAELEEVNAKTDLQAVEDEYRRVVIDEVRRAGFVYGYERGR